MAYLISFDKVKTNFDYHILKELVLSNIFYTGYQKKENLILYYTQNICFLITLIHDFNKNLRYPRRNICILLKFEINKTKKYKNALLDCKTALSDFENINFG